MRSGFLMLAHIFWVLQHGKGIKIIIFIQNNTKKTRQQTRFLLFGSTVKLHQLLRLHDCEC